MRITGLGHAGIAVRDLDASRDFYEGVLGVPLRSKDARALEFQVSESEQLFVRRIESPAALRNTGVHHIGFIVGNTRCMLDAAANRLSEHSIEYERVTHAEHESLYCRDPDGHLIELYYWPSW